MTASSHLTAGDLTPIYSASESTYGTEVTPSAVWGSIGEGMSFQPTDNPNPYLTWRYGSRAFSGTDYLTQQNEAGFKASFEVTDSANAVKRVVDAALAATGTSLPSRTVLVCDRSDGIRYAGVKTDELKISADVPGGVVKFEETALASYAYPDSLPLNPPTLPDIPAVQWLGATSIDSSVIYPQSFSITVRNNLGRALGIKEVEGDMRSVTIALPEGRQEIDVEMTLWMSNLGLEWANMFNDIAWDHLDFHLGHINPILLRLGGLRMVGGGNNTPLVQDKQTETVRLRATSLTAAYAEATQA